MDFEFDDVDFLKQWMLVLVMLQKMLRVVLVLVGLQMVLLKTVLQQLQLQQQISEAKLVKMALPFGAAFDDFRELKQQKEI